MSEFEELFFEELDRNPDAKSVWDVALGVLTTNTKQDKLLMFLKADLDIMRLIVEGYSAYSISKILGIESKNVFSVAKMWGFRVHRESLDVNPITIYKDGMSPMAFRAMYDLIVPVNISDAVAKDVIHNIERYHDIIRYLEEADE